MAHTKLDIMGRHLIPLAILAAAALAVGRIELEGEPVPFGRLLLAAWVAAGVFMFLFFSMAIGLLSLRKWPAFLPLVFLLILTFGRFLIVGCGESVCLLFLMKRVMSFGSQGAEAAFAYTVLIVSALIHLFVAWPSVERNAQRL